MPGMSTVPLSEVQHDSASFGSRRAPEEEEKCGRDVYHNQMDFYAQIPHPLSNAKYRSPEQEREDKLFERAFKLTTPLK